MYSRMYSGEALCSNDYSSARKMLFNNAFIYSVHLGKKSEEEFRDFVYIYIYSLISIILTGHGNLKIHSLSNL